MAAGHETLYLKTSCCELPDALGRADSIAVDLGILN